MITLEEIYEIKCTTPSDINEHLPTLRRIAGDCDHVTEMGVRWVVSTYALMAGKPKQLISYDIESVERWGYSIEQLTELAKDNGVEFSFVVADTTDVEIKETDFLFIDTYHVYDQLKKELALHGNKARKYLGFHDTTTFAEVGEHNQKGLWPAIEEFMVENPHWVVYERHINNNGLTILKRAE
jgi:hypothetical protein